MCTVVKPNLLADCQLSVAWPRKIGTNHPLQWVVVDFYSGLHNGYEDFSNFTHAPFQATEYGQTVHFPTVEQYFHYQKAKLFGDDSAKQAILNTNDPLASQTHWAYRSELRLFRMG